MAATKIVSCFTLFHSLSSNPSFLHESINSLLRPNSYRPISIPKTIPTLSLSRRLIQKPFKRVKKLSCQTLAPKLMYKLLAVCGLVNGSSETYPESEPGDLTRDASIDIKLPRRSLLVKFTCDLCGKRTNRLVNRLTYELGCEQYHKLEDNLGIVVEYALREGSNQIKKNMEHKQ